MNKPTTTIHDINPLAKGTLIENLQPNPKLRENLEEFLFAEIWPSVEENCLGRLEHHGDTHYFRWWPTSLEEMAQGKFGNVTYDVQMGDYYPSEEYNSEGNHCVTVWKERGNAHQPELCECDYEEVPREKAEWLVGDDIREAFDFLGEDDGDEEKRLVAEGWQYVRRTGLFDSSFEQEELMERVKRVVEDKLNYLTEGSAPSQEDGL